MAKILITGGAGFMGYHLASALAEEPGNRLLLVDNLSRGRLDDELTALLGRPNVELAEIDLTGAEPFAGLPDDFEYVYHLAAVIGVRKVEEDPVRVLSTNAISTLRIFEWARHLPRLRRVLFASTSEAYAGTIKHFGVAVPTGEGVPLTIDDVTSRRSSYAVSKIFGEATAFAHAQQLGLPVTVVRYHNVYGPRMGFLHVIPEMFEKVSGDAVVRVASPTHTRAFCYVADGVRATVAAASAEATRGRVLHVGNPREEIAIRELVQKIAAVLGRDIRIEELPDTPGSPARRCPDISLLTELTGFEPAVDLADGLRQTWDWYGPRLAGRYE
ncbi:MAG TPA: NAD-dependent epimerase/dehydratase family protein [Thermoanaerobaculia bacterium]|nr:NAD-dependent epimerase/dehydratase family protein [Thermoanaerobaculia bacterium]